MASDYSLSSPPSSPAPPTTTAALSRCLPASACTPSCLSPPFSAPHTQTPSPPPTGMSMLAYLQPTKLIMGSKSNIVNGIIIVDSYFKTDIA